MRLAGLVVALLVVSGIAGCGKKHSSSSSRSGDDPHDTDSLYALHRRILTDSNPVPTAEQMFCAYARLADRMGDDEAWRRYRALLDTVYTPVEAARWEHVQDRLGGHSYSLDDRTCGPGFEGHYVPDTTDPAINPRMRRKPTK